MMRHSNGWLRQSSSVKPGFTLGKKTEAIMKANNHLGYEVQMFYGPEKGWANALNTVTMPTESGAEAVMESLKKANPGKEFRVYESLEFPVKKK